MKPIVNIFDRFIKTRIDIIWEDICGNLVNNIMNIEVGLKKLFPSCIIIMNELFIF